MTSTQRRREHDQHVADRALQHDIRLSHWKTSAGQSVFCWWRDARHFGPDFPKRRDAIDWMCRWLDADTPAAMRTLQSFAPDER